MLLPRPEFVQRLLLIMLAALLFVISGPLHAASESATAARYRQALAVDPDNLTLHYLLGLEQLGHGQADAAIDSLRRAYPGYRDSIEMNYNLGLAYTAVRDADSALLYLEQAEALGALKLPGVFDLIDAYYSVAVLYLESDAFDDASRLLNKVLQLDPNRVEIHLLLGDIAGKKGRNKQAINHFDLYLQSYPEDQTAREYLYSLYFEQAQRALEAGDIPAAETAFAKARSVVPDSPATLYYLGYLALEAKDHDRVIDLLAPIYTTAPVELKESLRAMLYNSALEMLNTQRFDRATNAVAPLLAGTDARLDDLLLAGSIALRTKDYAAAIPLYRRALQQDPAHPQATVNLVVAEEKQSDQLFDDGLTAYKKGRFKQAVDLFDELLTIRPDDSRANGFRKKAVAKIAGQAKTEFGKARKAIDAGDYRQAILSVNRGLELAPNDSVGLRLRREALKALQADVTQLLDHGFALLEQPDYLAAEAQFAKVLEIDQGNKQAEKGLRQSRDRRRELATRETELGLAALDEGRLAAAAGHLDTAQTLVPDLDRAREVRSRLTALIDAKVAEELHLGRSQRSAGALSRAELHFQNALALRDTAEIHAELALLVKTREDRMQDKLDAARAAHQRQDYKTARRIYAAILARQPDHSAATELTALEQEIASRQQSLLSKGDAAVNSGAYRNALQLYRQVLDLEPANSRALNGLQAGRSGLKAALDQSLQSGREAFARGDLQQATTAYREVLQLDPYHADAKKALGKIEQLQQTGIRPGDENRLYLQGIDLYTRGQYEAAIKAWEQVLQLDPEHGKAKQNIEKARRKLQSIKEFQSG